jgi:hypothetical protein
LKVLVSCQRGQKLRKSDFCLVPEGEIVVPPFTVCDGAYAEDECCCARSLVGIHCGKGTTTACVRDINLSVSFIAEAYGAILVRNMGTEFNYVKRAYKHVSEMLRIAEKYTVGTVIEYRDFRSHERRI